MTRARRPLDVRTRDRFNREALARFERRFIVRTTTSIVDESEIETRSFRSFCETIHVRTHHEQTSVDQSFVYRDLSSHYVRLSSLFCLAHLDGRKTNI